MSSSSASRKSTSSTLPAVELGYLEEADRSHLESHFFPSKVGGRPAWLSFKPIPTKDATTCGVCGEPCVFLLQVYAPLDAVRSSAFHRTIYVFVCRNPECCTAENASNFVALRCQLPRENGFYGSEPIGLDEDGPNGTTSALASVKRQENYDGNQLCAICACSADKQCGQCKSVHYCCKSHQEIDWRSGGHKETCGKAKDDSIDHRRNPLAFPEFEMITEAERYVEKKTQERSEGERLRDYEKYLEKENGESTGRGGLTEESVEHLEAMAKAADKDFKLFRRRLEQNPEQVLRYQLGGAPLWADSSTVPRETEIPSCSICGAARVFEFQIMPHMLSYLDVDSVGKSLDWATVAIYTCKDSCDVPDYGYTREWIWKQDYKE